MEWINRFTSKVRGGLMVAVKVPMARGGYREFRTKEGVKPNYS